MSRQQQLIVLGAITDPKGYFLVNQYAYPDVPQAHLKWDFPGGVVEFGDTPLEALQRSIIQETGITTIQPERLLPLTSARIWNHAEYEIHSIILCYRCQIAHQEPTPTNDFVVDSQWVAPHMLTHLTFMSTTLPFINYVQGG